MHESLSTAHSLRIGAQQAQQAKHAARSTRSTPDGAGAAGSAEQAHAAHSTRSTTGPGSFRFAGVVEFASCDSQRYCLPRSGPAIVFTRQGPPRLRGTALDTEALRPHGLWVQPAQTAEARARNGSFPQAGGFPRAWV